MIENVLFSSCKDKIKSVEGMFMKCSNLSTSLPETFFEGMSSLESAKYVFANTQAQVSDTFSTSKMFEGSKLRTTRGAFLNCQNVSCDISCDTFDGIVGNTLSDTSYMFAGTGVKSIGTGTVTQAEAYVQLLDDGTYITTENETHFLSIETDGEKTYLKTSNNYINSTISNNVFQTTVDKEQASEFTIADTHISYQETVDGQLVTRYLQVTSSVKGVQFSFTTAINNATTFNIDNTNIICAINKYELVGHGLLSDCLDLTTTAYMFGACTALEGLVPEDIFYSNTSSQNYNSLETIEGMFDTCERLCCSTDEDNIDGNPASVYDVSGENTDRFVPGNWLIRCPNLKNIKRLFNNVGSTDEISLKPKKLTVPVNVFNNTSKIQTADYLFNRNYVIGNTSFNRTFLSTSLASLTSVNRMLKNSKVKSIGTSLNNALFVGLNGAKNIKLSDIQYVFYRTSITENSYCATPSILPNAVFTSILHDDDLTRSKIINKDHLPNNAFGYNEGQDIATDKFNPATVTFDSFMSIPKTN